MVVFQKVNLQKAAETLGVVYATAKTILRVYRTKGSYTRYHVKTSRSVLTKFIEKIRHPDPQRNRQINFDRKKYKLSMIDYHQTLLIPNNYYRIRQLHKQKQNDALDNFDIQGSQLGDPCQRVLPSISSNSSNSKQHYESPFDFKIYSEKIL